ncbi:hypothetical protein CPHLJ_4g245 [Cryptosporidium parvum]|nr:hypothetical protein CPCDC_4g245 [Cryptosporidium sp. 43IA8]
MRSPYAEEVEYSEKFNMDTHEYRATRGNGPLISEEEWRHVLGLQMSRGWVHFLDWKKEPWVLCFRRPQGTNPQTGKVDKSMENINQMNK